MSVNKVILVGNLGQNPEVKYSQNGQAVCNISIATNESWTDKNGQKQEKTEWHRTVVFGKLAELCAQYLSKGRQVYLEGKLQTRQWQDKEGQTRYTTEVVAQTIQFLGGQANAGANSGRSSYADNNNNYGSAANLNNDFSGNNNVPSFSEPSFTTEEDVPF